MGSYPETPSVHIQTYSIKADTDKTEDSLLLSQMLTNDTTNFTIHPWT